MKKKSRFTLLETLLAAVLSGIILTALFSQLTLLIRTKNTLEKEKHTVFSQAETRARLQNILTTKKCVLQKNVLSLDAGAVSFEKGQLLLDDTVLLPNIDSFYIVCLEKEEDEFVKHVAWSGKKLPDFIQFQINHTPYTFPLRFLQESDIACK